MAEKIFRDSIRIGLKKIDRVKLEWLREYFYKRDFRYYSLSAIFRASLGAYYNFYKKRNERGSNEDGS